MWPTWVAAYMHTSVATYWLWSWQVAIAMATYCSYKHACMYHCIIASYILYMQSYIAKLHILYTAMLC